MSVEMIDVSLVTAICWGDWCQLGNRCQLRWPLSVEVAAVSWSDCYQLW